MFNDQDLYLDFYAAFCATVYSMLLSFEFYVLWALYNEATF